MPNLITSIAEFKSSPEAKRPFLVAVDNIREAEEVADSAISISALLDRIGQTALREIKESPWYSIGRTPLFIGYKIARELISGPPLERVENASIAIVTGQVVSDLSLPPGAKRVFARHPSAILRYFPVATFHDDLFQDKLAELDRLLAHLGAKTVSIVYEHESGSSGKAEASAEGGTSTAGASAQGNRKDSKSAVLHSSFPRPKHPPTIPPGLSWLHEEPLWRQMADLRISHGRLAYQLELKISKDYGVNAEVAAGMKGLKLNIGGEYKVFEVKHIKIDVEFWPVEE